MEKGSVAIQRHGRAALVSLEEGSALEALAQPLADALGIVADDESIAVVVVAAPYGIRSETFKALVVAASEGPSTCAAVVAAVRKPTIAWLDGDCLDGGLELALACDLRLASPAARFGIRHVHSGALPADGGTQRLSRLVGRAHALRLLLTGDVFDSEEALRIGLVQRLGGLDDALTLADRIGESAPIAAAYAKEAVLQGMEMPLAQGLRLEADLSTLLQSTEDRAEGLRSFFERRPPKYEGR